MTRFLTLALLAPLTLGAVAQLHAGDDHAHPEKAAHAAAAEVSKAELEKAIAEKKAVVIDCNGSESYLKGHIPSAIDFSKHGKDLAAILPKEKDALIVAYCGGPACGAYKSAVKAASELGYTNVKHYPGGLSGWKTDGGALETK